MNRWLGALVLLFVGCGSLFTIEIRDESVVTIEQGTLVEALISDMEFDFTQMDLTSSTSLENQNVADGDIDNVYMTEFTLTALNGDLDLAFIDSLQLYVESPGLPRVLIASQDDFPDGVESVSFDLEDVELTEYVVSESMDFTTEVSGERPSSNTDVLAEFAVDVGVTGQGACNNI